MTQADERAPFEQLREALVVADVHRDVLRRRTGEQRLLFGHHLPLCVSKQRGVHNKASRAAQAP